MVMKRIEPKFVGDWVFFNDGEEHSLRLPSGIILSKKTIGDYYYDYSRDKKGVEHLIAVNKSTGQKIILLPHFFKEFIHEIPDKRIPENDTQKESEVPKVRLVLRASIGASDTAMVSALIARVHYRRPPNRGSSLILEFFDDEEKKKLQKILKERDNAASVNRLNDVKDGSISIVKHRSPDFSEILCNATNMIGCLVLDRLTYGVPNGRNAVAKTMGIIRDQSITTENWRKILREIPIVWISRVAVASPYMRIGFGTAMARGCIEFCDKHLMPAGDYVEVITTESIEGANKIIRGRSHYFTKAGFSVYNQPMNSKRRVNEETGKLENSRKLYFYRKVNKK